MASILGKQKGKNLSYASIKRELKKIKSTSLRYRIVELGMRPDRADVIAVSYTHLTLPTKA